MKKILVTGSLGQIGSELVMKFVMYTAHEMLLQQIFVKQTVK